MTAIIEESIAEVDATPPAPRQRGRVLRAYLRRPLGVVSALFLLGVVVAVALAHWIAPYGPLEQDLSHTLSLPSGDHLLGTDRLGRDVLSRLLYGGRITLIGVGEALGVAFVIGVTLGLLAGYLEKTTDVVISRAAEIMMAVPGIVVLLMIYSITDNNPHAGMITLGVLTSPTIVRVTRTAAASVRREVFVSSAQVAGVSPVRIIARHVLPNVWGPVIVNTAVLGAVILGIQAGLNYITLGIDPPNPSWGSMVSEGQQVLAQQEWLIVPSGALIALVIIALMFVADALRDATASAQSRQSRRVRRRGGHAADPARHEIPVPSRTSTQPQHERDRPSDYDSLVPAADRVLSVRNLSVRFSQVQVVRDVHLDLAAGTTLGIVGESGCGKTVTASAILGSLGRTAQVDGVVEYDGLSLLDAPRKARTATRGKGIAYVTQEPMVALDPSFTVASQLGELVGRHDNVRGDARRRRVLELLTQVGLPDPEAVARRYPHQLSGGMAQRISIACALAGRPRVLVADEPTTALDVTIQGEILSLLRELQEQTGMAIVLITHDLGVVADLCDQVAVMYAGEIVELADVDSILTNPRHPYTRALVASNPIMAQPGTTLRDIPGTVPSPADWPAGCHFAARCPFSRPECSAAPVPLERVDDRFTRCIRVDDIDAEIDADHAEPTTFRATTSPHGESHT